MNDSQIAKKLDLTEVNVQNCIAWLEPASGQLCSGGLPGGLESVQNRSDTLSTFVVTYLRSQTKPPVHLSHSNFSSGALQSVRQLSGG